MTPNYQLKGSKGETGLVFSKTTRSSTLPLRFERVVTTQPWYLPSPFEMHRSLGAQDSNTPEFFEWLRNQNASVAMVMSVCIGAVKLARAGLLDGKSATTHPA
jgi:transcriptional regulator GlxA family with amidase domain